MLMSMSLEVIRNKLTRRLAVVDAAFERQLLAPSLSYRVDRQSLNEGIISYLWQSWCSFCREILISSVKGAMTRNGTLTASPFSHHSEAEIAYIAQQLANNNKINIVKSVSGSHQEPTWGDFKKINNILSGIGLSNGNTLLSAFGSSKALPDLQLCRNACAHITKSTIHEISSMRVRYNSVRINHPSDIMFWIDPTTRDFVWKTWCDEIDIISELAIQ